jgi:glycosyltransferase involved in cell wall biosynthesis
MAPTPAWKRAIKRPLLGQLFSRVDQFLCIGTANRDLYRTYGVPESKLHMAPYAVDNGRFALQANQIRKSKLEIRKQWGIPEDAYCVLFCGKFIAKKRPFDLIKAAQLLLEAHPELKAHLLFAGSGELGTAMRAACSIAFDADQTSEVPPSPGYGAAGSGQRSEKQDLSLVTRHSSRPVASFTGFLNQTEISKAYVAADCLVLSSDYSETWGLVVNEAMASGLRCIISDRCGCAPDLGVLPGNSVFRCGDVGKLADRVAEFAMRQNMSTASQPPSLLQTVEVVEGLYAKE